MWKKNPQKTLLACLSIVPLSLEHVSGDDAN